MRKIIFAAAVGIASLGLGAAALTAAGAAQPLYLWTYYSDASLSSQVGWSQDECLGDLWVSSGPVQGQRTDFFTKELIGSCPGDLF